MSHLLGSAYYVSPEDYLAGEQISEQKHEYLAGVVYAMAGTAVGHARIAGNILTEFGALLRGRPCEVFSSDVKVRIRRDAAEFYYYPDVTVDCSEAANDSLYAENPRVIFEVLSPETERIDRGEKLRNYQSLPSLEAYVLVDQLRAAVTVYRRTASGWAMELYTDSADSVDFPGIECRMSLAAMYARTSVG